MKKAKVLFGMIFMLFSMSVVSLAAAAATIELPVTAEEDYGMAQDLLNEINKGRVSKFGRQEMQMDSRLQEIAMLRAAELAVGCGHYRPFDYPTDVSVEYRDVKRENIAFGQGNATFVYTDWDGSPGHASAMYDKDAYTCGIGCITNESTIYWVLVTSANKTVSLAKTSGKRNVTRNIKLDPSRIKLFIQDWHFDSLGQAYTGSSIFFNKKNIAGQIGIFSKNIYENDVLGFRIPANALTYTTSTPNILSITQDGLVTPKATGTGSITVSLKSYPSVQATLPVTVLSNVVNALPTMTFLEGTDFNGTKSFPQTGQPIMPKVKVVDCYGSELEEGFDYRLEYGQNTNVGLGTVKAVFINNYVMTEGPDSGISLSFYILPSADDSETGGTTDGTTAGDGTAGTSAPTAPAGGYITSASTLPRASLSSLKSAKKKTVLIKWQKKKGVSGYQIQYALNKKFTKGNKTKTVAKAKKTSVTIRKLKTGKLYYVRIRTYKKVNGVTYYGKWSKAKKIRVK